MERNYDEFNFCTPVTDVQQDRVVSILKVTCPNRIVDWRDNTTLWVWKEGKTPEDDQWSEEI